MKILRLSLFNLKKNKREAIGIMVLTFFTAFMLIIALSNKIKVDTAFDESFERSGSTEYAVLFRGEKYRDGFRHMWPREECSGLPWWMPMLRMETQCPTISAL